MKALLLTLTILSTASVFADNNHNTTRSNRTNGITAPNGDVTNAVLLDSAKKKSNKNKEKEKRTIDAVSAVLQR